MTAILDLRFDAISGLPVARVSGEIDESNIVELGDRLADATTNEQDGLIVDLSRIKYLDSAGVHLLFDLAVRLKQRRQSLRVVVMDGSYLEELLETVRLKEAAATDHTVGEAVAALTRTG
jgi:anti-anti-sigma factor